MAIEYRKAARRDAERADLMRRAAALLREVDKALADAEVESLTLAISICVWQLEESAKEADSDALSEFEEDTPVWGLGSKR